MNSLPQTSKTILRVNDLNQSCLTGHSSGGEDNGQQQKQSEQSAEPE